MARHRIALFTITLGRSESLGPAALREMRMRALRKARRWIGSIASSARSAWPLLLFASLVAGCATPAPGASAAARAAEADALLRRAMDDHRLPSISVAVSVDGRIAYRRAMGLADREAGVPATPDTVYAQGSVSKVLTAVGELDRPAFRRHPGAIIHGNHRGVYGQQQAVHGRVPQ